MEAREIGEVKLKRTFLKDSASTIYKRCCAYYFYSLRKSNKADGQPEEGKTVGKRKYPTK